MGWWYVRRVTGENVGPLNESGVEAELDAGRLMPDGWVCPAGASQWVQVSAQRVFAGAVKRAVDALGDAPTAYSEDEKKARELAALYDVNIEGRGASPAEVAPPHGNPVLPSAAQPQRPLAPPLGMEELSGARPAPTLSMDPPAPVRYPLTVTGPDSGAAPVVPTNPLTEPIGATGWAAIGLTAMAAFASLVDAGVQILFGSILPGVVAGVALIIFAIATVLLVQRRTVGYRMAAVGHGVIVATILVSTSIVVVSGGLSVWMIPPVVRVLLHIVGFVVLYAARGLFWIR